MTGARRQPQLGLHLRPAHGFRTWVLLGFTADGEHLMFCCGPLASPSRLELRRVRLQWPGLSKPGEASWSLPLDAGVSDSYGSDADREDLEEEAVMFDDLQMGVGHRPASVAVTESADGLLVVTVVALRRVSAMQAEEDRVYHVFVAPSPSYTGAVHASTGLTFWGSAFSYIVPGAGGGSSVVPSIAAHDVGAVDGGRRGGQNGAQAGARLYVIVLNAVDTVHFLEVALYTEGNRCPPDAQYGPYKTPSGTKFVIRPPSRSDHEDVASDRTSQSRRKTRQASATGGKPQAGVDPLSVWWAFGKGLPSTPLIHTCPLNCYPPTNGTSAARANLTRDTVAPAGSAAAAGAADVEVSRTVRASTPVSSAPAASTAAAAEAGRASRASGRAADSVEPHMKRPRREKTARASIDGSRQRVLDLEVFISQLLRRREAFPSGRRGDASEEKPAETGGRRNGCTSTSTSTRSLGAGGVTTVEGESTGPSRRENGGHGGPCRSALATDYHCLTVGFLDGGRWVLLCLVVEVVYSEARGVTGEGRRRTGYGAFDKEPELLGYVLALDLGTGDVAVLATRSARGSGMRCAPLCDTLARSVRRRVVYPLAPAGRRVSNAALLQGRSLGVIVNPVFPVAVVMRGAGEEM